MNPGVRVVARLVTVENNLMVGLIVDFLMRNLFNGKDVEGNSKWIVPGNGIPRKDSETGNPVRKLRFVCLFVPGAVCRDLLEIKD